MIKNKNYIIIYYFRNNIYTNYKYISFFNDNLILYYLILKIYQYIILIKIKLFNKIMNYS